MTESATPLAAGSVRANPFYVFLMFDQNDTSGNTVMIDRSRNFAAMALAYKRGSRKVRRPIVKKRIYDWRLDAFIGPFPTRESADKFRSIWAGETGNTQFMRARGVELAERFKRLCVALRPQFLTVPHKTEAIETKE